jgi:hypothetical protein
MSASASIPIVAARSNNSVAQAVLGTKGDGRTEREVIEPHEQELQSYETSKGGVEGVAAVAPWPVVLASTLQFSTAFTFLIMPSLAYRYAAGGQALGEPQDDGFMYMRGFRDLDGHQWSFIYMDMSAIPEA